MYATLMQEKKFPWGGRVIVARFPAHNTVSFIGSIAAGARIAGSEELADVHAQMLLEGTLRRDKRTLQRALDDIGATLEFHATEERLAWSGKVLAKNLDVLLGIVSDILREPAFPEQELAVLKQREQANLAHEAQDTNTQASIALHRMLYPKGHPNYSESTEESRTALQSITAQKLRAFHQRVLGRKGLALAVSGDIAPARVFALTQKYFAVLPNTKISFKPFRKATAKAHGSQMISIPDKASIHYLAGVATSMTEKDSSFIPLHIGVSILGSAGGFVGRLMKTVREEDGLTYGVYAYFSGVSARTDGFISLWATFAPQLFERGTQAIMREVQKIITEGVSDEEVVKFRELLNNRRRVQLSNTSALAAAAHSIAAEGRPISYLDDLSRKTLAVTTKQVNAALKKYLRPEKLSEATAGPVK